MIKTQVLLLKIIQGRLRLGLGLGFFYFILNAAPLTRDVTCSKIYLDGMRKRQC